MKLTNKTKRIKTLTGTAVASATVFLLQLPIYAATIQSSKIAKGTQKLIGDLTKWLMILAPVVAGALIIYFFIRRSAADEMDQKKWNNRIITAIISCIGAVLGSVILQLVIGYYM